MKDHSVSKRAKDVIIHALCQWVDHPGAITVSQPDGLFEVVDALIDKLESAGFAIEIKTPVGNDASAIDIGHQALKVRRAEDAVKAWITEKAQEGYVARAHQAPGWLDYQRENEKFKLAVAAAKGA